MKDTIKVVECPRDAMQGMDTWIPTKDKIRYIEALLKVGFHTLDAGSFVSHKAIPQLKDTVEVFESIDWKVSSTRLLAIVANLRGAEDAAAMPMIKDVGFPFSVSETFQQRNTHSSIAESLERVKQINACCADANKSLVIYISMGFGNPYGDVWSPQIVIDWSRRLYEEMGIKTIALSDTVGVANPETIDFLFRTLIPALPEVEFGAHLHTTPNTWKEKIDSAWKAGCRRFDGAIRGYGGCPMAADDLTGNMPTENLLSFFEEEKVELGLNVQHFATCVQMAEQLFLPH